MIIQQPYRPLSPKEMKDKRAIKDFIITIDTTKEGSASNTFVLPIAAKEPADVKVSWGDGNFDSYSTVGDKTHVYAEEGIYQIKVSKEMTHIRFNNVGDKMKLLYIDNWGYAKWVSMYGAFYGCANMQGRYNDFPDTSSVTDMYMIFSGCSKFNAPVNFDTSNVTVMTYMFINCLKFNQPVLFDTSKATEMGWMFQYAGEFKQTLKHFNLESMTGYPIGMERTDMNEAGTTTNYDETLISWGNQNVPLNISTKMGDAKYSLAGKVGRDKLIAKGWTLTDGGLQE